ncbi:MAG: hypothetical protein HY814_09585 [Candidatus Riflebacteria bacterium]|nr:hypothetical protein [Candidatus Riflebacteria bacterium]
MRIVNVTWANATVSWVSSVAEAGSVEVAKSAADLAARSGTFRVARDDRGATVLDTTHFVSLGDSGDFDTRLAFRNRAGPLEPLTTYHYAILSGSTRVDNVGGVPLTLRTPAAVLPPVADSTPAVGTLRAPGGSSAAAGAVVYYFMRGAGDARSQLGASLTDESGDWTATDLGQMLDGSLAAPYTAASPHTLVVTAEAGPAGNSTGSFSVTTDGIPIDLGTANLTAPPGNHDPTANAGLSRNVPMGKPYQLDGSASSDPDGDGLTYVWRLLSGPSTVSLAGADNARPSFTPAAAGVYVFSLTVLDGRLGAGSAELRLTSVDDAVAPAVTALQLAPQSPIAVAGDVVVALSFSEAVATVPTSPTIQFSRVSGTGSIAGGPLTRLGDTSFTFHFVATSAANGTYLLQISAEDLAGNSLVQQPAGNLMTINVSNRSPEVNAGPDLTATVNLPVSVHAVASDPDGDPLVYTWTLESAPQGSTLTTASLSGRGTVQVDFTPDRAGTFRLGFSARDGRGGVTTDEVLVNVSAPDDHPNGAEGVGPGDMVVVDAPASTRGTVSPAGDVDFFGFDASVGRVYRLELEPGTPGADFVLTLYDPLKVQLRTVTSAAGATVALADFRPTRAGTFFLRVSGATPGTVGDYTLRVLSRLEVLTRPPALSLSFSPVPGQLEARVATLGTTVPLSTLSFLFAFDAASLAYQQRLPGDAATAFDVGAPERPVPTLLGLTLQSKSAEPAVVPTGTLATLAFGRPDGRTPPTDSVAILNVTAVKPGQQIRVFRPTADAGVSVALSTTHTGDGHAAWPDSLAAPGAAPVPYLRLDGRGSVDPNTPARVLEYRWRQLDGPPVQTWHDALTSTPRVVPGQSGTLRFGLTVSNGVLTSATSVVTLWLDAAGHSPTAEPRVVDPARHLDAGTDAAPLAFVLGDTVVLDATRSTASNVAYSRQLQYEWAQTAGPPRPSLPAAATTSFVVSQPGLYRFSASVIDPGGLRSESKAIEFLVRSLADTAPTLSLAAQGGVTSAASGGDLGDVPELASVKSLRVAVGTAVQLAATVSDPEVAGGTQKLSFFWSQTAGPALAFTQDIGENSPQRLSRISLTPTGAGVYQFTCRVRELDAAGNQTGVEVARAIRLVADDAGHRVPEAGALVRYPEPSLPKTTGLLRSSRLHRPFASTSNTAGHRIELVSANPALPTSGHTLTYRWTQVLGPTVALSNPYAPVTTFVAPDLRDGLTRHYAFQFYVDDSGLRGEPAVVSLDVAPVLEDQVVDFALQLHAGLNLVSLPLAPLTTLATGFDAADLTRLTSARLLGRAPGGPRLVPYLPGLDLAAWQTAGGEGYVLVAPGPARTIPLSGSAWPATAKQRELAAGLNLIGYPGLSVPPALTTTEVVRQTGARFVARVVVAGGQSRFECHLPGLSPGFTFEAGRAYLLSIPSSARLTMP